MTGVALLPIFGSSVERVKLVVCVQTEGACCALLWCDFGAEDCVLILVGLCVAGLCVWCVCSTGRMTDVCVAQRTTL
jgi:hypothetical protein